MAYILADRLEEFFRSLHLKTTLHEMGIDDTHFDKMANRATNNGKDCVGHYVAVNKQIFVDILKMAL